MGHSKWSVIVAVALLVFPTAGAAWNQLGGEAARSLDLEPPRGTLDIVGVRDILPEGHFFTGRLSPYFVAGPDGFVGVATTADTDQCQLVHLNGSLSPAIPGCLRPSLQGYWPAAGAYIACGVGPQEQGLLVAFTRQEVKWAVDPRAAFGLATDELNDVPWSCDGVSITDSGLIVPFYSTGRAKAGNGVEGERNLGALSFHHRIAKIGPDGQVMGQTSFQLAAEDQAGLDATPGAGFLPLSAATTSSGSLISGLVTCPSVSFCRSSTGVSNSYLGAAGWIDNSVDAMALKIARPRVTPSSQADEPVDFPVSVSSFGAGSTALLAAQIGGVAYIVDPSVPEPEGTVILEYAETQDSLSYWPGPVWQDHRLVIPTDRQLTFLDPGNREVIGQWATGARGDRIVDVVGDRLGRLFVLSAQIDVNATVSPGSILSQHARLTILDREGDVLHAIPVQAATRVATDDMFDFGSGGHNWLQPPRLAMYLGELYVLDAVGGVSVVGDAQKQPIVEISNRVPARDEDVRVVVDTAESTAQVIVRWGTGVVDEIHVANPGKPILAVQPYPTTDRYDLLVTVVDQNGTTLTGTYVIDVGAPRLSIVQKAFSDEYEDTTWGVIGILLAIFGGLYTFVRLRRSRARVQRELERIDEIQDNAKDGPLLALRDLQELRQHLDDRTATGYFDQGQANLIETRAARAARGILMMAIEAYRSKLDPEFRTILAGHFEDGRVTDHEMDIGLAALERQRKLSVAEKDRVRQMYRILVS